jgi:hypothetical protein
MHILVTLVVVVVTVPAEQMHVTMMSTRSPNEKERPDSDQRPAREHRKEAPRGRVDRNAAPGDEHTQRSSEQDVTSAGHSGDGKRLGMIPSLCASGYDEWQPMGWNRSVEERYRESGDD